jgi:isopenicillin N synthase-like dioxygenase
LLGGKGYGGDRLIDNDFFNEAGQQPVAAQQGHQGGGRKDLAANVQHRVRGGSRQRIHGKIDCKGNKTSQGDRQRPIPKPTLTHNDNSPQTVCPIPDLAPRPAPVDGAATIHANNVSPPQDAAMTLSAIPVVSYADLQGDAVQRQRAIAAVGLALEQVGFFILDGPPLSPEVVRRAYQVATEFFALGDRAKTQYSLPPHSGQGGFSSFGSEQAKGYPVPDLKEFWHVNHHSLTAADAPWPQEVPSFRPILTRLYKQLALCGDTLLEACALYLGQPQDWLVTMARGGNTVLRLAHYPAVGAVPQGSLRAAPHEDINLITLLCAATAPGLEILTGDGWLPVQADPGQLVVDTGDMLQNLTNGLFKSTTHRVVNPRNSHQARLSMPFFVHPRPEVDLTPVDSLVDRTGGTPQFPPITAGEYLAQRLREIQVA